jgi:3-dehydroquinate synthetase/predicted O-methyltransferase YrrM
MNTDSATNKETMQLKYYDMQPVDKEKILKSLDDTVAYLKEVNIGSSKTPEEFVEKTYNNDVVRDTLIYMSQLPAFSSEFALTLQHNLDLLAVAKKLKYFTNNTLGFNAIQLKNLAESMSSPIEGMQKQVDDLFEKKELADTRVKDYMPS